MNSSKIKSIKDAGNIRGKRVVLRADFNLAVLDGKVVGDYRVRMILPTLSYLQKQGARTFIISHIEGGGRTLRPVFDLFVGFLPIKFAENLDMADKMMKNLPDGSFVLIENIRNEPGETENNQKLAKKLAGLGDLYVNEAFSASHRKHASIVSVSKYLRSYVGPLFINEVRRLSEAFEPDKPAFLILGGAKLETKLPVLKKFSGIYDSFFVGGGLANELLRARQAGEDLYDLNNIVSKNNFHLPSDVWQRGEKHAVNIGHISDYTEAVDCGAHTNDLIRELVTQAKFVLWNGTLGVCEEGYTRGTHSLVNVLIKSEAKVFVGGGDTVSEIDKMGRISKFDFVSTGGGAMLDFLANGTLPGIDALIN